MQDREYLNRVFEEAGMGLTEEQEERFLRFYELLIKKNEVMNLTAITEYREACVKHFVDSCMLFSPVCGKVREKLHITENSSLVDVGTGAGFPGLPLKLVAPGCPVLLLDSLRKRIDFLREVIEDLKLSGVEAVHLRAEEGKLYREKYDVAVSRAVAALPVLLEYCLPFVRVGGTFVAFKAGEVEEELKTAGNALKILGGEVAEVVKFELPEQGGSRSIIFVKKVRETPKRYPRKAGTPAKEPLR